MKLLLILIFLQLSLQAKENKDINRTIARKVVTVENVIQKSKAIEDTILSSKNLDFYKIDEHETLLLNYYLFEKNLLFTQKILQRSIELYAVDSLETKISYLNLAYAYLYTLDFNSAKIIYDLVEDTKENMPYEKNIILECSLLSTKANYELLLTHFDKSSQYFSEALVLMKKHNLTTGIGYMRMLHNKAFLEYQIGNYDNAFNLMIKVSKTIQKNNITLNLAELGEVQTTLALILLKQKKNKQANMQLMSILKLIKDSGSFDLPITIKLLSMFNVSLIATEHFSSVPSNTKFALKIQKRIGYKNNDIIIALYMYDGLAKKTRKI